MCIYESVGECMCLIAFEISHDEGDGSYELNFVLRCCGWGRWE